MSAISFVGYLYGFVIGLNGGVMAEVSQRSLQLLAVLVLLLLASNFLISCMAIAKVNRSANDYVVTEARFARAVSDSTTNFLAGLAARLSQANSTNQTSKLLTPEFKFVRGLCIYYSYSRGDWVARYRGADYYFGDYFPEGLIVGIVQGRLYCQHAGRLVVVRPSAEEAGVSRGPTSPPTDENGDSPLDMVSY